MIELENGYVILVDSMNYTLAKKVQKKAKDEEETKDGYRNLGYYRDLGSAINGYWEVVCKLKLEEGEYSLKEAVELIKSESKRVANLVKGADAL